MSSSVDKFGSSLRKWTLRGARNKAGNSEDAVLVELKDLGLQNGTGALSDQQPLSAAGTAHAGHPRAYLYTVIAFTVLGGLLFGYDTGVIAGALLALNEDFEYDLDAIQQEMIVAVTVAAAMLGSVAGALLNDRMGRRPSIVIASAIYTIGAVVMSSAPVNTYGWVVVLAGRLIVGIGIGVWQVW